MNSDNLDFLTTVGREFSTEIESSVGELPAGQECYEAISNVLGSAFGIKELSTLSGSQLNQLATSFNKLFEVSTVTPDQMKRASSSVILHWPLSS